MRSGFLDVNSLLLRADVANCQISQGFGILLTARPHQGNGVGAGAPCHRLRQQLAQSPWHRQLHERSTLDQSRAAGHGKRVHCFFFRAGGRASAAVVWPRATSPAAKWSEFNAPVANEEALDHVRALLQSATIGFRLLLAGPEADVYRARATALDCGAQDDELALTVTSNVRRRVHCAHCKTLTETNEPIGAVVECSGCARSLLIYHHFSRRTTSYLGFMVNAEDVA